MDHEMPGEVALVAVRGRTLGALTTHLMRP